MQSYKSLITSIRHDEKKALKSLITSTKPRMNLNDEKKYVSDLVLEALKSGNRSLTLDLTSDNLASHRDLISEEQNTLSQDEMNRITNIIKQYIIDGTPPHINLNFKLRDEHKKTILDELNNDGWLFYTYTPTDYSGGGCFSLTSVNRIRLDDPFVICRTEGEVDTREF